MRCIPGREARSFAPPELPSNPLSADGGLRVDSREERMKGGASGAAMVVGEPEACSLMQVVCGSEFGRTPSSRPA